MKKYKEAAEIDNKKKKAPLKGTLFSTNYYSLGLIAL